MNVKRCYRLERPPWSILHHCPWIRESGDFQRILSYRHIFVELSLLQRSLYND